MISFHLIFKTWITTYAFVNCPLAADRVSILYRIFSTPPNQITPSRRKYQWNCPLSTPTVTSWFIQIWLVSTVSWALAYSRSGHRSKLILPFEVQYPETPISKCTNFFVQSPDKNAFFHWQDLASVVCRHYPKCPTIECLTAFTSLCWGTVPWLSDNHNHGQARL